METLAIICLAFVFYTYIGYPFFLMLAPRHESALARERRPLPSVTVLLAVRNEEVCLAETLRSIVASDYPPDKRDVLVVSDGSTDATDDIIRSYAAQGVRLHRLAERKGKVLALSEALPLVGSEILVLTDASSLFEPDAIRRLVSAFSDPRVGAVGGSKRIRRAGDVSTGDGLYLRYDAFLRHLESRGGASWVGCEGGLYAIRRPLFKLDYPPDLANDYAVCCRVYEQGYLNLYNPRAVVWEKASKNFRIEWSRKVRVIVRGIRAFVAFRRLLNPFLHPQFFFQNFSHRLCRWLVPFFLVALFVVSNVGNSGWLKALLWAQVVFYSLAALGAVVVIREKRIPLFSVPLYFSVVNIAAAVAWFTMFKRISTWTPTLREETR